MLLRINFSFLFIALFTICSCNANKSKDNSAPATSSVPKNINVSPTPKNSSNDLLKEMDRLLEKVKTDTLTRAEKLFLGEVLIAKIKNSATFRKQYVQSQLEKWKRAENNAGGSRFEGIIKNTFGDEAWNEYQIQKKSKENKTDSAKN